MITEVAGREEVGYRRSAHFGSRTSGRRLRREIISLIYWLKALSVHPLSTRRWTSGDSCLGSWTGFPNSPTPGLGLVRRKDVSFTNVEVDKDEIRDEDDDDTGDRLELDEEDLRRKSLLGGGRMTLRLSLIMLLLIRLVLTSLKLRLNLLWSSSPLRDDDKDGKGGGAILCLKNCSSTTTSPSS